MNRRELLAAALAAPASLWAKRNTIDRTRLSSITDESAKTPAEAIAFAHEHKLKFLELRGVPGSKKHYSDLTEAELKQAAREFADGGVKISFFNSGQCKFLLPGTERLGQKPEAPEARAKRIARDQVAFDKRIETMHESIRAAQLLGCDKVRIFAFLRAENHEQHMPRIYDIIGGMVKEAEKTGIKLLLENEVACNVARCDESAKMLKAIPSKALGFNWDPLNGHHMKEEVFPHGYSLLPKKRLMNVQVKGKSILKEFPADYIDWAPIFTALEKDNYAGEVGLECHIFGAEQIKRSHQCIEELARVAENRAS